MGDVWMDDGWMVCILNCPFVQCFPCLYYLKRYSFIQSENKLSQPSVPVLFSEFSSPPANDFFFEEFYQIKGLFSYYIETCCDQCLCCSSRSRHFNYCSLTYLLIQPSLMMYSVTQCKWPVGWPAGKLVLPHMETSMCRGLF